MSVGNGGGGGSSGSWGDQIASMGPSVNWTNVLTIVLCFVIAALFTATIFVLASKAGAFDQLPPISKETMRKYQDHIDK